VGFSPHNTNGGFRIYYLSHQEERGVALFESIIWTLHLFEEPLISLSSPLCLRFLLALSVRHTGILAASWYLLAKEPPEAIFHIF